MRSEKVMDGCHCLQGVLAGGREGDLRAATSRQGHETHDAAPGGLFAVGFHRYHRLEWPQRFDQQSAGPGVQTVFSGHDEGLAHRLKAEAATAVLQVFLLMPE